MREESQSAPAVDESSVMMPEHAMAVQKLYESCRATFTRNAGSFPAQGLQRVRSILDSIKPSDVGLDENAPIQQNSRTNLLGRINGRRGKVSPAISYLHLYECNYFSMGIFCLPKSAVIPLHNHPGMTVMSKLLYGSMHVKAYDWVDHNDVSHPRLAKLVVDRTLTAPCESSILYPKSGGNMHVFTAITPCAVLDVLAPPYSAEDGRHCTYFRALPYASRTGEYVVRCIQIDKRKIPNRGAKEGAVSS
ncbi:hypothetical protein KP509_24G045600 [Ceratopteris richardii]|uniref:cysteine dioxygenase n=1 Tax=Ceratopteris richardii TaxID=49495 RepID=A0A8T2RUC4_CERRI|nr:hypothetical protein KP509_24G045600 [Ceratopteris richardii]